MENLCSIYRFITSSCLSRSFKLPGLPWLYCVSTKMAAGSVFSKLFANKISGLLWVLCLSHVLALHLENLLQHECACLFEAFFACVRFPPVEAKCTLGVGEWDYTISENEKLFVCGVPFQFEGSAECLLFHLLNQDFEWELCLSSKCALTSKLKLSWAYLPYIQL